MLPEEVGSRQGTIRQRLRWFAAGLFIIGFAMLLFEVSLGRVFVKALYEGSTGTFLDQIIEGQYAHPVQHYYTLMDGIVLKMVVGIWLLSLGIISFSLALPSRLLAFFLAIDAGFIILDVIYAYSTGVYDTDFSITKDRGYAELFQYVKELGIALLFLLIFIKNRGLIYLSWHILFMYILFDDFFMFHEHLGYIIAQHANFPAIMEIRPRHFGELFVSACFGSIILTLLAIGYYYADTASRKVFRELSSLLIILTFISIVLDMVNAMDLIQSSWLDHLAQVTEEGGEMFMISILAWYVYRLSLDPARWSRSTG